MSPTTSPLLYPVTTGPPRVFGAWTPPPSERKPGTPHIAPDLAALTGEQADNCQRTRRRPGFGGQVARREYGSLDTVIENSDKIGGKKGEALRENIDNVVRNHHLVNVRPST